MPNPFIRDMIQNIVQERRGISREFVVESLKSAILDTVRRVWGEDFPMEVDIVPETGDLNIYVRKRVVRTVQDPRLEISFDEARKILDREPVEGEDLRVPFAFSEFTRGMVKQIQNRFLNRIRNEERQYIYRDFKDQIRSIKRGKVQKVEKSGLFISLGKVEGFLPQREMIPGERYRESDMIRVMILRVEPNQGRGREPQIILSRTHPDFLKGLLELEIPEITEGRVQVRAVARRPGERAKVAVWSTEQGIDPVGACVGPRGTRLHPIQRELHGERIDVVRYSPDPVEFAANALSPIVPRIAYEQGETIVVGVNDDEVSEAKGKEGINVILASELVGRRIEVHPFSEVQEPPDAVSVYELDLSESLRQNLLAARKYVFRDIPPLADLLRVEGMDEGTALRILNEIEQKLQQKRERQATA